MRPRPALARFADRKLLTHHLVVTLVDLRDWQRPVQPEDRGRIYRR